MIQNIKKIFNSVCTPPNQILDVVVSKTNDDLYNINLLIESKDDNIIKQINKNNISNLLVKYFPSSSNPKIWTKYPTNNHIQKPRSTTKNNILWSKHYFPSKKHPTKNNNKTETYTLLPFGKTFTDSKSEIFFEVNIAIYFLLFHFLNLQNTNQYLIFNIWYLIMNNFI